MKEKTAFALVALALAALALLPQAGCGGSSEPGAESAWVLGRWQGKLTQKGLPPFMVWASVRSLEDANANRVRYSGLGCRGRWVPLGGGGEVYRFREEITAGRSETCKGVGIVALRHLPASRIAYTFRGGGIESQGRLTAG